MLLLLVAPFAVIAQQFGPSVKLGYGFAFLPSGEQNYKSTYFKGGAIRSIDLEFSFFHDNKSYYNSTFVGFTTGIKHLKIRNTLINKSSESNEYVNSLALPLLFAIKANEWGDVLRVGLLGTYDINRTVDDEFAWAPKDYHLDAYISFGFDNKMLRYQSDGWIYTVEIYGQYSLTDYTYKSNVQDYNNIKLVRVGGRVGFAYVFDYYHYRRWYRPTRIALPIK